MPLLVRRGFSGAHIGVAAWAVAEASARGPQEAYRAAPSAEGEAAGRRACAWASGRHMLAHAPGTCAQAVP